MLRFERASNGRGASFSRILAFALFPGIALLMLIPTVFVTDTVIREATASARAVTVIDADRGAPNHDLPAVEALPGGTPTAVPTSTTAPTVIAAANTPSPDPATVVVSAATSRPVAPTSEPLPVAQLTEVPLVPTESPAEPHVPITRLVIPAIGVDAAVETKSVDPDGAMQTPDGPAVVSWYDFSSQPQDDGNAVFAGHLDYAGYGPAVFWDLHALAAGDVIEVHQLDGSIVQYQVTEVRPFAATDNASDVVSSKGRPTITLITCDGTFDSNQRAYDQRLVVTGDRID
ncbi:hypothetical protein BH23CHL2_BH23CHL2_04520 [soil metagenome]